MDMHGAKKWAWGQHFRHAFMPAGSQAPRHIYIPQSKSEVKHVVIKYWNKRLVSGWHLALEKVHKSRNGEKKKVSLFWDLSGELY